MCALCDCDFNGSNRKNALHNRSDEHRTSGFEHCTLCTFVMSQEQTDRVERSLCTPHRGACVYGLVALARKQTHLIYFPFLETRHPCNTNTHPQALAPTKDGGGCRTEGLNSTTDFAGDRVSACVTGKFHDDGWCRGKLIRGARVWPSKRKNPPERS